jgi:anti-sigma factor RsiW
MSVSPDRMMKLMAYADGELDGVEKAEVEKLVESNEEAARIVNAMLGLGDYVRAGHESSDAKTIAKVDLTDAIMKKVADEKPDTKPDTNVRSLDAARGERDKKRNVGVGIVAALALAASVFFVMQNKPDEKPMASKPVVVPTQTQAVPVPTPNQMASNDVPSVNASTSAGVEVEAVQSPGHSVSVFYLPTANELSTSVTVWVDETAEKK